MKFKLIILLFSITLTKAQNKIVFGNYSFEVSKDFKRYNYSPAEINDYKNQGIILPSDFFIYKGDLDGKSLNVAYWISNDEFMGANSEFENLLKDEETKNNLSDYIKLTLPKNANLEFKKLNSVHLIQTNFQRTNQDFVYNFFIFELGKRYTILITFNDENFSKYKNEIINSLKRIN